MNKPIIQHKPGKFITVIVKGEKPRTLVATDIAYKTALRAWHAEKWDEMLDCFDRPKVIAKFTEGAVQVFDNEVLHNGKKVNAYIERKLLEALRENNVLGFTAIARFLNNLMENPIPFVQADLYEFLETNNMPITIDGAFLAFKLSDRNGHPFYQHTPTIVYKKGSVHEMDISESNITQGMCDGEGFYFGRRDYWNGQFDKDGRYIGDGIMWVAKVFPQWVRGIPSKTETKGKSYRMEIVDEYRLLRRHVWDKHFVDLSKVARACRGNVTR